MSSIYNYVPYNPVNDLNTLYGQASTDSTSNNITATPDLSALYSSVANSDMGSTNNDGYNNYNLLGGQMNDLQGGLLPMLAQIVGMIQSLADRLGPSRDSHGGAGLMPHMDIGRPHPSFDQLDLNGDGNISRSEFEHGRPPFGGPGRPPIAPPSIQQLLSGADTNSDGAISQAEFNAFQTTLPNGQPAPAPNADQKTAIFSRLDTNGDGSISQAELEAAPPPPFPGGPFGPNDFNGPPSALQQFLAPADANNDGAISATEFSAFQPLLPDGQALPTLTDTQKAALFSALDKNTDSSISPAEIAGAPSPSALNALLNAAGTTTTTGPTFADLYSTADTNADGAITQTEFNAATPTGTDGTTLPTLSALQKNELYALLDLDSNDSISSAELASALSPTAVTGATFSDLYSTADTNNDGSISATEFSAFAPTGLPNPRTTVKAALFAGLDADSNGAISQAELTNASTLLPTGFPSTTS
jgi:Ca2+-binding EF-hand superfamily protein